MKTNRWFPVTLLTGVSLLSCLPPTSVFADDTTQMQEQQAAEKLDETAIQAALARLPESDRGPAAAQRYCPVMESARLGTMGTPIKVMIAGKPVFLCCAGCQSEAVKRGKETVARVEKLKRVTQAIAKLPATDQPLAEAQLFCAVAKGSRLGGMGTPVKLILEGQPVFLCCQGCEDNARANPQAILTYVEKLKKENVQTSHHANHKE